jgi:hypothetical protein
LSDIKVLVIFDFTTYLCAFAKKNLTHVRSVRTFAPVLWTIYLNVLDRAVSPSPYQYHYLN